MSLRAVELTGHSIVIVGGICQNGDCGCKTIKLRNYIVSMRPLPLLVCMMEQGKMTDIIEDGLFYTVILTILPYRQING